MKDKLQQARIEKTRKLQEELTTWQTVATGQQIRISRLEVMLASIVSVLERREGKLEHFIRRLMGGKTLVEEVNEFFVKKMEERRQEFLKQQEAEKASMNQTKQSGEGAA